MGQQHIVEREALAPNPEQHALIGRPDALGEVVPRRRARDRRWRRGHGRVEVEPGRFGRGVARGALLALGGAARRGGGVQRAGEGLRVRAEVGAAVEVREDERERGGEVRAEGVGEKVCRAWLLSEGVRDMCESKGDARALWAYATSYSRTAAFAGCSSSEARLVEARELAASSTSIARLVRM